MSIDRRQAVTVVNYDRVTVSAVPSRGNHLPALSRIYGCTGRNSQIDARVTLITSAFSEV